MNDSARVAQQVIETLNPSVSAVRAFSFRQHLADAWYDLHHPDLVDPAQRMVARFETRRADFPRNVEDLRIEHVTLYLASRPGSSRALDVGGLRFTPAGTAAAIGGAASSSTDGLIGTRQGNAASWLSMVGQEPMGPWELTLPDTDAMRGRFRNNEIEDLLFVLTYGGRLPAWPA